MKFALPIALGLALAVCGQAQAQSTESSSSSASTSAASGTSPAPTPSSSSSSSAPSSSPTSAPAGGAESSGVCSVLVGDPTVRAFDCTYSSTSTPPYDASSIQSYLIGGYSPNQGEEVGAVATELAESVLNFYPTMTASVSQIASVSIGPLITSRDTREGLRDREKRLEQHEMVPSA
ncbi:hypothetical protein IE81DRAFT_364772 [Ceraceosorus guamensis]|uniref:Uncharacterized protein n=1 Tax=Ceraceosorus guamensis TaxID=1522189 RepID=A0A316WA28_9BASI|nr:hypothetical protein IE81DRAFT_364772 [Ceraceosorus guamensis]PWN44495.1 hypothetical protein IE81DRAFT_364772 [Ceraceosorus guamensis]